MKPGKRHTLLIFAAMCTLIIAIMKASEYRHATRKEARYKCTGYTVVDAHHVRTCEGDTIKKDWQILKRYK